MKAFLVSAGILAMSAGAVLAEGQSHHIVFHVDENDPAVMNLVLNNIENVNTYYEEQGDEAVVELVAYGPGLNMLISGQSPVAERVSAMALQMDNLTFAACGNTMAKMAARTGTEVVLLSEATVVPAGVVRLVELQEQGYAYIRP